MRSVGMQLVEFQGKMIGVAAKHNQSILKQNQQGRREKREEKKGED